ncbi:hypothetical protein OE88DRAFT_1664577 [Heliocybe sulcata]|uniref:Uncharacterized protein n=1 Tax=Heliocybe sulcata TaxID=5364 RepID=A0A5C3MTB4_9AGAM|nr:hypothetical protein OE88DRAFT_1664577 [Heliocybe sulcata]
MDGQPDNISVLDTTHISHEKRLKGSLVAFYLADQCDIVRRNTPHVHSSWGIRQRAASSHLYRQPYLAEGDRGSHSYGAGMRIANGVTPSWLVQRQTLLGVQYEGTYFPCTRKPFRAVQKHAEQTFRPPSAFFPPLGERELGRCNASLSAATLRKRRLPVNSSKKISQH